MEIYASPKSLNKTYSGLSSWGGWHLGVPTCMIEADAASLEDDSVAVAQIKAQMCLR